MPVITRIARVPRLAGTPTDGAASAVGHDRGPRAAEPACSPATQTPAGPSSPAKGTPHAGSTTGTTCRSRGSTPSADPAHATHDDTTPAESGLPDGAVAA